MKLIITSEDPDLDAAASTFAYAELLKKKDDDEGAVGSKFGDLDEETNEILEELDESITDASYYLYSADEIIIVSASTMDNISRRISPDKVVEIVDHENISADDFPDADLTIEEDASTASTVITHKYMEQEIEISNESATLLYEAITSTIEDLDSEGTERDREAVEWLEEQVE